MNWLTGTSWNRTIGSWLIILKSAVVSLAAFHRQATMASSSSQSIVLRYPTTATGDAVAASASTPSAASGAGGFQGGQDLRLLEISNDLAKEIEQDMKRNGDGKGAGKFLLTIKGKPSDDAVICTRDRTFQIRSISVSNSLLLFQQRKRPTEDVDNESSSEEAAADQQPNIELQSTVREIMELLPMVPRLDRVQTLLSGTAWQGMASEAERQRMEMETPTVSLLGVVKTDSGVSTVCKKACG